MQKKILIVISEHYPLTLRETYIEEELIQFSQHYHKIFVLSPKNKRPSKYFDAKNLPENIVFAEFSSKINFIDKIGVIKYLITHTFWKEIWLLLKNPDTKLNFKSLKQIFEFLSQTEYFIKVLSRFLKSSGILKRQITIYTYHINPFTLAACKIKRKFRLFGVFSRVHEIDAYNYLISNNFLPFRNLIFRRLNAIFPVNQSIFSKLNKEVLFENTWKVKVSRLGVSKPNSTLNYARIPGKIRVLTNAFHDKAKKLEQFIIALEKISSYEVEWLHVGEYHEKLGIKQMAFNRLFQKNNIRYEITGEIPRNEAIHITTHKIFDVFLNISIEPGIPVAMIEALSMGIPVLTNKVEGIDEIVHHNFNGIVASKLDSPEDISENLKFFLQLSDQQNLNFRLNSQSIFQENFNAEKNYNELAYNFIQYGKQSG